MKNFSVKKCCSDCCHVTFDDDSNVFLGWNLHKTSSLWGQLNEYCLQGEFNVFQTANFHRNDLDRIMLMTHAIFILQDINAGQASKFNKSSKYICVDATRVMKWILWFDGICAIDPIHFCCCCETAKQPCVMKSRNEEYKKKKVTVIFFYVLSYGRLRVKSTFLNQ